tara:strand:- start:17246 stop:20080 length:2835 start_codon:yes stop_codon:yes gene_type:complete
MAKISDTTSYPNIAPVADDYLILTDYNSSLATKTVTVDALSVYLFGNIGGSLIPTIDDTYDIGSPTLQWRNLYIDGIANIDSLSADVGSVITLTVPTSFTTNGTTVFNGAISGTSFITSIALTGASNTNIASTLAIKTYVDTAIATVDDLGGSYDTSTTSVNLPTQSLRILGTANQITTTGDGAQTMQIAFPTNITTPGQLNSGGPIIPTATTFNIGTTALKWAKLFSTDIADNANSSGTANQFLRKSAANALEWSSVGIGNSLNVLTSNSGSFTVDLSTQSLSVVGTSNEIDTSNPAGQSVAIRLPLNITTRGQLNSLGAIIPTTNISANLGSSVNRWLNFFTKEIADATGNFGVANQILAKNVGNTGLEWRQEANTNDKTLTISDGTTTGAIDLPTEQLKFTGTTNQLTATVLNQEVTFAFPTNITTPGQFNSGGALVPTANDTYNIGTTGNKWAKLFSTDIADGANSSGTANQVLAKNASNALEWQAQAGGGSMTSWDITDGTTAQTIANGEVVTLAGTTSQITTTQASGTVTFSIPTALTIPGTLSSTGDVIPVTDQLIDLGGDGNRWKTTWTKDIADANDGLGTAAQVLAKNAANTGLEWVNATSGSGTVTSVAATTAGDALDVSVTTPTVAASLEFSFAGTAAEYISGQGNLLDFPAINFTSLTTTGSSGVSTLSAGVLNIPNYVSGSLEFLGDSNTGTPSVNLSSQSFTISGTTNEIVTSGSGQALTIALPTNITTNGQLNSTGAIIPVTDSAVNLGTTTKKWLNIFVDQINDEANSVGTANQVLAKNASNSGLEWQAQASSSDLLTKTISISNAAMKTLSSSPVELVAAPGANQVLVVDSALFYLDFVSPAFNLPSDLFISYSGSSATIYRPFAAINSTIANSSADVYVNLSKVDTDNNNNGQCRVNEALDLGGPNTATGGGTVKIKIQYRIENLS